MEPLWKHLGLTLALLWVYEDDLGSLLGHFGTWVTLKPLWGHFGHMMRICAFGSPQCAKNNHFLMFF